MISRAIKVNFRRRQMSRRNANFLIKLVAQGGDPAKAEVVYRDRLLAVGDVIGKKDPQPRIARLRVGGEPNNVTHLAYLFPHKGDQLIEHERVNWAPHRNHLYGVG